MYNYVIGHPQRRGMLTIPTGLPSIAGCGLARNTLCQTALAALSIASYDGMRGLCQRCCRLSPRDFNPFAGATAPQLESGIVHKS